MAMASGIVHAEADPSNWDTKAVEVLKQMHAYTDSTDKFVITTESYLDSSIGGDVTVFHTV